MPAANVVPTEVGELKDHLYQILQDTNAPPPAEQSDKKVSLRQDLGVNLSPTIKKDGVNIIQLQSVDNRHLTVNVIEALKTLDSLHEVLLTGQCKIRPAKMLEYEKEVNGLKQQLKDAETKLLEYDGDVQDAEFEESGEQPVSGVTIESLFGEIFQQGTTWSDFQDLMKKKYAEVALSQTTTIREAAQILDLQPSYFSTILKKLGIGNGQE